MAPAPTGLSLSVLGLPEARRPPLPPDLPALAARLSASLGSDVPYVEGGWADLPARGFVFLSLGHFLEEALAGAGPVIEAAAARLVFVELDRAYSRDVVMRHAPAAIVEEPALADWLTGRREPWTARIVGRAEFAGDDDIVGDLPGTAYAWLQRDGGDLAGLLADYLRRLADRDPFKEG